MPIVTLGFSPNEPFKLQMDYHLYGDNLVIRSLVIIEPPSADGVQHARSILESMAEYAINEETAQGEVKLGTDGVFYQLITAKGSDLGFEKIWLYPAALRGGMKASFGLFHTKTTTRALMILPNPEELILPTKVVIDEERPFVPSPRLTSIAESLKLVTYRYSRHWPYRNKRIFMSSLMPQEWREGQPTLSDLSVLAQKKLTPTALNRQRVNDFWSAFAYHRWFPTRRWILPKQMTQIVRQHEELQTPRIMDLWVENYIRYLSRGYRIQGKEKAQLVSRSYARVKERFSQKSIDESGVQDLIQILLSGENTREVRRDANDARKITQIKIPRSLIDEIGMCRTHAWKIGRVSFGFEKLFRDFPKLAQYRDFLRLQVWIKQYAEALTKTVFNKKPEKVIAILDALKRVNSAIENNPLLTNSIHAFLNYSEPGYPSVLQAIMEKRDPLDTGMSHGHELLCKEFKELKVHQWIQDYCQRLKRFPGKGRAEKANHINDAFRRALKQTDQAFDLERFMTYRFENQMSLIEAIKIRRDNQSKPSLGFLEFCREFQMNPRVMSDNEIELNPIPRQTSHAI